MEKMFDEIGCLILLSETGSLDHEYRIVKPEFWIGASVDCALRIIHSSIPDRLCVIKSSNGKASIFSLNSEEPVLLNDQQVSREGNVISEDDVLRIFDMTFKWKYVTKENALSRSFISENVDLKIPNLRHSAPSSVLTNINDQNDKPVENEASADVQTKRQDEPAAIKNETFTTPKASTSVRKPYISTSCKINRSSAEYGSKVKRLVNTCVKRRRSRNLICGETRVARLIQKTEDENSRLVKTRTTKSVTDTNMSCRKTSTSSPFTATNTFISDSKRETEIIKEGKNDLDFGNESVVKSTRDNAFSEDISTSHSAASQLFHSTPKPCTGIKYVEKTQSPLSSSVDFNFEISTGDNSSRLKVNGLSEGNGIKQENLANALNPDVSPTTKNPIESNLRQRSFILRKNLGDTCLDESSTDIDLHLTSRKLEDTKGNVTSTKKSLTVPTPSKRTSEISIESRRNTRGRTSMLRKTFEEKSGDGDSLNKEKSLTTPEKSTEISVCTMKSNMFSNESAIESTIDTKLEFKSIGESSKSGFASVSDDNETCESSFIDKYKICCVVKNVSSSPASIVKCARNLSYISPPENNRSQEYMDSMVATPKKSPSVHDAIDESYNVTVQSFVSTSNEVSMLDQSMPSPLSLVRKRRSTGFVPFVGTPSNVYRTTRKMSTPFNKSRLSRTSTDFESNIESSRGRKRSSERRSTPYKSNPRKSSMRDSVSLHPPIKESISFEELEASAQNDEPVNDFRFVTARRRYRYGDSPFAAEDKILEESELKSDDSELDREDNSSSVDENSFEDENLEASMSAHSTVHKRFLYSEGSDDISTANETKLMENSKTLAELKSILTPLPKSVLSMREKSAKKVTFALPNSTDCSNNSENTDFNGEGSFAMISCAKVNPSNQCDMNELAADEELYELDKPESDASCDTVSVTEGNVAVSDDKLDDSSVNLTGVGCLLKTPQTSVVDVSGVEQIPSADPSPSKSTNEVDSRSKDISERKKNENANPIVAFDQPESAQSYSPGVFLSGVKSLLKTPDASLCKSKKSKCNLSFRDVSGEVDTIKASSASRIANVVEKSSKNSERLSAETSHSELYLSGVKTLLETPEAKNPPSSTKGSKRNLSYKSKTSSKPTPNDKTTKVPNVAPHLIRKSAGTGKINSAKKPSRMCKSLNMNEIKNALSQEDYTIEDASRCEFVPIEDDARKEISTCNVPGNGEVGEIVTKKTSEENVASDFNENAPIVSTSSESSTVISCSVDMLPKIVVTDATLINDDSSLENTSSLEEIQHEKSTQLINKSQQSSSYRSQDVAEKEPVKSSASEIADGLSFEDELDSSDNFVTSDHDGETDQNETISSDEDLDPIRAESPVFGLSNRKASKTPLCKVSPIKKHSVSNILASECLHLVAESKENERNESLILAHKCNETSKNTSPEAELSEETVNESKSSLEVMTSGRESSRLSDLQSIEDDIVVNESIEPQDNLEGSPVCKITADDIAENQPATDKSVGNIINSPVEKQSTEYKSTKDAMNESTTQESESTLNSQDLDIQIDVSSDLVNELHDELETESEPHSPAICSKKISESGFLGFAESTISQKNVGLRKILNNKHTVDSATPTDPNEADRSSSSCDDNLNKTNTSSRTSPRRKAASQVNAISTPQNLRQHVFATPADCNISRSSVNSRASLQRCRQSGRIHRVMSLSPLSCSMNASIHNCSITSEISFNESNVSIECSQKKPEELYKNVVQELNLNFGVKSRAQNQHAEPAPTAIENTLQQRNNHSKSETGSVDSSKADSKANGTSTPVEVVNRRVDQAAELVIDVPNLDVIIPVNVIPVENVERKSPMNSSAQQQNQISQTNVEKQTSVAKNIHPMNINLAVCLPRSRDVSIATVQDESANAEPIEVASNQVPEQKRNTRLRTRRNTEFEDLKGNSEDGIATRNRRKRDNKESKIGRPLSKTTADSEVIDRNEILNDKENVCAILDVLGKSQSKKMKLSASENVATTVAVAGKTQRKTRRLKNVENISPDSDDSVEQEPAPQRSRGRPRRNLVSTTSTKRKLSVVQDSVECERRCSIVLPILNPEIIRSPVKVDEAGNIVIGESEATMKKRRATRATKKSEDKPNTSEPSGSGLRSVNPRQTRTVTFKQQSPLKKRDASPKNKTTSEVQEIGRSRKKVVTAPQSAATRRNTRNQSSAEAESCEPEKKARGKRVAKLTVEVIAEAKVERPKRTRTKAKEVETNSLPIANVRPKRGVKNTIEETVVNQAPNAERVTKSNPKTSKRAKNDSESNKNEQTEENQSLSSESVKNSQNLEEKVRTRRRGAINAEPVVEKACARRKPNTADSVEETVANEIVLPVEPVATLKPTRGRKKVVPQSTNVTRAAKNKKSEIPSQSGSSNSDSETSSITVVTRSGTTNARAKSKVITKTKKVSLTKKGRVSLTLKTISRNPEPASTHRTTRSKAK